MYPLLTLALLAATPSHAATPPTFEGACQLLLQCRCAPGGSADRCVDRLMKGVAANPYGFQHVVALTQQGCHNACATGDDIAHGRIAIDINDPTALIAQQVGTMNAVVQMGLAEPNTQVVKTGATNNVDLNANVTRTTTTTVTHTRVNPDTQVIVLGSMVTPEPVRPSAISSSSLLQLIHQIEGTSFGSDKVAIVQTAAAHNAFTVSQMAQVLEPFSFSGDKLKALSFMAPNAVDPQNAYLIGEAFTFSGDKTKAQAMFR